MGFLAGEGRMAICLPRREFIAALAGAAAWPLASHAQQDGPVRRIGLLMPFEENDRVMRPRVFAFERALADMGWSDGRNLRMDLRWAGFGINGIRSFA